MPKSPSLLVRLLKTPDLAKIVPQLQPEVLHRVIQTCGLEDCAEFVALATPEQLGRILDLDIWSVRSHRADETFDADRFGVWIAVLMEAGPGVAAEKLAGLDIDLVITGLARNAAVFDGAAAASYTTLDGEHVPGRAMNRGPVSEIGGYLIEARRTSAWEAIVDLLAFLATEHREYFHRLMRGCVRLSNGPREEDGVHDLLEDDEQDMFDLMGDREARRERQGYLTPAQAQAFLRGGRDLPLDAGRPARSPIARAYFRAIESTPAAHTDPSRESDRSLRESRDDARSPLEPDGVAGLVEVLREAGVLTPPPRALLGPAEGLSSHLPWIQAHVASEPASAEELAYLANAIIAGCSIQGRPFTAREASDGAVAICNLGLQNWPSHWSDPDLVTAFQVGWTILYRDVCMDAAERLIDVLARIQCGDRDIQLRLDGLRHDLIQAVRNREPWRARHSLDVILMLDAPAWASLLALIDECPVVHAALSASRQRCRAINPTDFTFISENRQIAAMREFMASLPSVLAG
jgi:hypothetical protein